MDDSVEKHGSGDGRESRRNTYLIDRKYQLREVNRVVVLFVSLLCLELALFILFGFMTKYGWLDSVSGPVALVACAFAVPMVMGVAYSWLTVRHTHKVAGAAYRLRQDIPNLLKNPSFRFHLRKGDYLQEIADELNGVIAEIEKRNTGLSRADEALLEIDLSLASLDGQFPHEIKDNIRERIRTISNTLKQVCVVSGK